MAVEQNLTMVRGDTLSFDLVLSDMDGSTVTSIFFTAKKKATDETPVFQKSLGDGISLLEGSTYRVRVAPEDTAGVAAGKYARSVCSAISTPCSWAHCRSYRM